MSIAAGKPLPREYGTPARDVAELLLIRRNSPNDYLSASHRNNASRTMMSAMAFA